MDDILKVFDMAKVVGQSNTHFLYFLCIYTQRGRTRKLQQKDGVAVMIKKI